jgi:hypothetical protein
MNVSGMIHGSIQTLPYQNCTYNEYTLWLDMVIVGFEDRDLPNAHWNFFNISTVNFEQAGVLNDTRYQDPGS